MKKSIITVLVALLATMGVNAQQIAVVSEGGTTTLFQTLDEAVTSASSGSVIYLPGGGFQIKDETKINKRLTIMGVSHRADADNADGGTTISGNLSFEKGSDGSSVMGVYLSGDINISSGADTVKNILVRYANVNCMRVRHSDCSGINVNQCFIRNSSDYGGNNVKISNCICHSLRNITGGVISHCVFTDCTSQYISYYTTDRAALLYVHSTTIMNNIIMNGYIHNGSNCQVANNLTCAEKGWGDSPLTASDWSEIFVDHSHGISIASDYKLKGATGKKGGSDGTDVGIYGGSGFSDAALAPIPRIISKAIPEQTDASGKLKIQVTVKAN